MNEAKDSKIDENIEYENQTGQYSKKSDRENDTATRTPLTLGLSSMKTSNFYEQNINRNSAKSNEDRKDLTNSAYY